MNSRKRQKVISAQLKADQGGNEWEGRVGGVCCEWVESVEILEEVLWVA